MITRYLPFIGRVLIGLPFAMSGLGKLAAYGQTTAMIAAAGLPFPPLAFVVGRSRRIRWGSASGSRLPRASDRARASRLFSDGRRFIPQQFRRPEPDDPLSKGRHVGRRPPPNRRLRAWSDQHRAVAPEGRNAFRS
jgi:hypothetical protein